MNRIFKQFQILYGSRWATEIAGLENEYVKRWREGLHEMTKAQLKNAVVHCAALEWPPSISEFKTLCHLRPKRSSGYGAYVEFSSPPKIEVNEDIAKEEINKMKLHLK